VGERQVRIEWDRAAVARARAGRLEIADGEAKYTMPLDGEHLGMSGVTYARRTDTVEVRMRLAGGGEESVRFAPAAGAQAEGADFTTGQGIHPRRVAQ
jgi:hypothetical protein